MIVNGVYILASSNKNERYRMVPNRIDNVNFPIIVWQNSISKIKIKIVFINMIIFQLDQSDGYDLAENQVVLDTFYQNSVLDAV